MACGTITNGNVYLMGRPGEKPQGRGPKVKVKTGKGRTVAQKQWLERQLNDPYVAEAKRQLFGRVGIDLLAGLGDVIGVGVDHHRQRGELVR